MKSLLKKICLYLIIFLILVLIIYLFFNSSIIEANNPKKKDVEILYNIGDKQDTYYIYPVNSTDSRTVYDSELNKTNLYSYSTNNTINHTLYCNKSSINSKATAITYGFATIADYFEDWFDNTGNIKLDIFNDVYGYKGYYVGNNNNVIFFSCRYLINKIKQIDSLSGITEVDFIIYKSIIIDILNSLCVDNKFDGYIFPEFSSKILNDELTQMMYDHSVIIILPKITTSKCIQANVTLNPTALKTVELIKKNVQNVKSMINKVVAPETKKTSSDSGNDMINDTQQSVNKMIGCDPGVLLEVHTSDSDVGIIFNTIGIDISGFIFYSIDCKSLEQYQDNHVIDNSYINMITNNKESLLYNEIQQRSKMYKHNRNTTVFAPPEEIDTSFNVILNNDGKPELKFNETIEPDGLGFTSIYDDTIINTVSDFDYIGGLGFTNNNKLLITSSTNNINCWKLHGNYKTTNNKGQNTIENVNNLDPTVKHTCFYDQNKNEWVYRNNAPTSVPPYENLSLEIDNTSVYITWNNKSEKIVIYDISSIGLTSECLQANNEWLKNGVYKNNLPFGKVIGINGGNNQFLVNNEGTIRLFWDVYGKFHIQIYLTRHTTYVPQIVNARSMVFKNYYKSELYNFNDINIFYQATGFFSNIIGDGITYFVNKPNKNTTPNTNTRPNTKLNEVDLNYYIDKQITNTEVAKKYSSTASLNPSQCNQYVKVSGYQQSNKNIYKNILPSFNTNKNLKNCNPYKTNLETTNSALTTCTNDDNCMYIICDNEQCELYENDCVYGEYNCDSNTDNDVSYTLYKKICLENNNNDLVKAGILDKYNIPYWYQEFNIYQNNKFNESFANINDNSENFGINSIYNLTRQDIKNFVKKNYDSKTNTINCNSKLNIEYLIDSNNVIEDITHKIYSHINHNPEKYQLNISQLNPNKYEDELRHFIESILSKLIANQTINNQVNEDYVVKNTTISKERAVKLTNSVNKTRT